MKDPSSGAGDGEARYNDDQVNYRSAEPRLLKLLNNYFDLVSELLYEIPIDKIESEREYHFWQDLVREGNPQITE